MFAVGIFIVSARIGYSFLLN